MSVMKPPTLAVVDFVVVFVVVVVIVVVMSAVWMKDVMGVVSNDEDHLSVREKLIQMLGSHLELWDEIDHLLGDVFCSHSQLDHGHVLALFVAESRVPELVDGFVIRLEGLFG